MWSMDKIKETAGMRFRDAVTLPSFHRHFKCKIPKLARRGDKLLAKIVQQYRTKEAAEGRPTGINFESAEALFRVGLALGVQYELRSSRRHMEEFFERALEDPTKHIMRNISEPMEAIIAVIEANSGYDTAVAFIRENIIEPLADNEFNPNIEKLLYKGAEHQLVYLAATIQ